MDIEIMPRRSGQPKARIFIDTSVIYPIICPDDETADQRDYTRRALDRLPKDVEINISQIVLGELLAKMLDYYNAHESRGSIRDRDCLFRAISLFSEKNAQFPPFPHEGLGLVQEIADLDSKFKKVDPLIISHALADPLSIKLLTIDGPMIRNMPKIRRIEDRLLEEGKRTPEFRLLIGSE